MQWRPGRGGQGGHQPTCRFMTWGATGTEGRHASGQCIIQHYCSAQSSDLMVINLDLINNKLTRLYCACALHVRSIIVIPGADTGGGFGGCNPPFVQNRCFLARSFTRTAPPPPLPPLRSLNRPKADSYSSWICP